MASEASWQTSGAGRSSDALSADQPMDQRTVESLLRRLVERVEESERRYGEALEELHARLDQLSQTTEAARDTGSYGDAETFDRLQMQVSDLARRFEQDTETPLDDFERLGKALSGGMRFAPLGAEEALPETFGQADAPSPFAPAAMPSTPREPEPVARPAGAIPDFSFSGPETSYPPVEAKGFGSDYVDLDKRLVEMAHRLEQSIGTVMPTGAIEALNTKLDEIGNQLNKTLEQAPTRENLEHVERQISDMGQQLGRAEAQLGKMSGIEGHLLKLIERLDEKQAPSTQAPLEPARIEEIASKAAIEAAHLVAGETQQGTAARLDAMQRDLTAMSDKSRESSDRLTSTLQAVHESLKQLVQQVERGGSALQPKPRAPFAERIRASEKQATPAQPQPAMPQPGRFAEVRIEKTAAPPSDMAADAASSPKDRPPRNRLGAGIPDFKETEAVPPFGRAKRNPLDEGAVDLDASGARPAGPTTGLNADMEAPGDLVAAARRAAQAAALRAEERSARGRRFSDALPGSAPMSAEAPARRKRPVLIIAAAILLLLSAALLYGRLKSKPEAEVTAPATERTTPAPADSSQGTPTPDTNESAPATEQTMPAPADSSEGTPNPDPDESAPAAAPEKSGSWAPLPDSNGAPSAESREGEAGGFTEVAKSSNRVSAVPASELTPEPQLASLKPAGQPTLPPGVVFSVEDPSLAANTQAAAQGAPVTPSAQLAMPAKLPMPPAELGPLALREAASTGDARAQYIIAVRYADGEGTARDLKEAASWLERAASAGLAPAQYRLGAMYEHGLGVDKDLGRARSWYAAAAEKGNIKAMHNLAVSVSGTEGGEADYALAAKWYAEAANYGLADSQFNLGILAEHGLGIEKNLAEAFKWFALAAATGDTEAAKRRDLVKAQLDPAALAEAEAAVKAWKAEDAVAEANEVAEPAQWASTAAITPDTSLVSRAQTLLNKLGYDVGPPDGVLGSRTRAAIKLFEHRNGFDETGEVSIPLVTKLEHLTS